MDVVLIPAYEPEEILLNLTKSLRGKGFSVLVVNDGSSTEYDELFEKVKENATVISHEKNKGKGAALKTGIRYVLDNMPECENVITCDADGQHKEDDVVRVQKSLHNGQNFVLTIRTPKGKVPLRSRFGNALSRFVYTILTNHYLSDNQCGLRGFNRVHLPWLAEVEKDNYDYEMNVLYHAAKKNIYIATIEIEALYINNNSLSHFNPILDTVRIYRSLFTLARGNIISFLVAELLAVIVSLNFQYEQALFIVPSIGAVSCLISWGLNRYWVFRDTVCYDYWRTLIYTVISYFVYTLMCMLCTVIYSGTPFWLDFTLVYIICIPFRYFLHKFIFIASRTKQ